MSCCGQSRSQEVRSNTVNTLQPFPISQQPTPHPRIDPFPQKPSPNLPTIPSPTQVHPFAGLTGNQPSPPSSSTAHGGSVTSSPPPLLDSQMVAFGRGGSTADAVGSLSPLRRPSPSYPASGSTSPNLLSTYQPSAAFPSSLPPTTDEGKMSVAIDFGERRVLTSLPPLRLTKKKIDGLWFRNYLFGRGKSLSSSAVIIMLRICWCLRLTALRVLLREKYSKFCIGPDRWKRLEKFQLVFYMMNGVKCSHGAWKLKIPSRCPDPSNVNGTRFLRSVPNLVEHDERLPLIQV
jgi:hypothetical protein